MESNCSSPLDRDFPTRHPRSRWWRVAGSTAALGAAAGTAHAKTVQIDIVNNLWSHTQDLLFTDLTGDGNADFQLGPHGTYNGTFTASVTVHASLLGTGTMLIARARYDKVSATYNAFVQGAGYVTGTTAQDHLGLVPIIFSDSRINGGAMTNGFLEVRAKHDNSTNHVIQLVRLVFDDASTTAPMDAMAGDTKPSWVDPTPAIRAAKIASLNKKIKKLKKALRKATKAKKKARVKSLKRKIKISKQQLALL